MDIILKNIINNNSNYIIKKDNQVYQIPSISSQRQIIDNSISIVDLGECENVLKNANGIDANEELLIFKIDNYFSGFNIPIVE